MKNIRIRFLLVVGTGLLISGMTAQNREYSVRRYTVDHGLPNNHVRGIVQDSSGFIWIAMWDAVSRYDGYDFLSYYHDPEDSLSVPGMNIFGIEVDKANRIWIGSALGLSRYVRETGRFTRYPEISSMNLHDFTLDENGQCVAFTDQGIFCHEDEKDCFEPIPVCPDETRKEFLKGGDIISKESGQIWIGQYPDFYCLEKTTGGSGTGICCKVSRLMTMDMNFVISNPNFRNYFSILQSGKTIFLAANQGFYAADTIRSLFKKTDPEIILDQIGHSGLFWNESEYDFYTSTSSGFFRYHKNNPSYVETCLTDRNGTIWMGEMDRNSEGLGLKRISFNRGFFRHYLGEDEMGSRLAVLSVHKDSTGTLWTGTIGNPFLYEITPGAKPQKSVFVNSNLMPPTVHLRSVIAYRGKVWAGNSGDLLFCFNPENGKIEWMYPGPVEKAAGEKLKAYKILTVDKKGRLVIGGCTGFGVIDFDSGSKLLFYDHYFEDDIFSIYHDCDSNYWIGLSDGKMEFIDKYYQNKKIYLLANARYNIESIIEDDSAHLWLALLGGGIARFNKKDGTAEIFSVQNGLKNSTCYNLLKDKHGHVWVSTNQGLSMFNPVTKRFRNFGEAEGLKIVEFNADAVWHGEDDEMIFGGMGGFVSFYPDSIESVEQAYYAPLRITEISSSGVQVFPDVYLRKSVELSKGMDNFQVTFACLDYLNADKLLYRYRVSEMDTGWINTDARKRFANYLNLDPGTYHFEVQATDPNGNWQEDRMAALAVTIPPYYFQTFWFKAVSSLSGVFLIIVSIMLYIRQLKFREQRKREMLIHEEEVKREQLKLEALRGQLNPHFIFNSLNSVNDFILDNDPVKANQYLTDFAGLMRAFLENSKQEYLPLLKEIELLENYLKLEQVRFTDRFDYDIDYEEVNDLYCRIMPSMIQPFVENSVWHGIGKMDRNRKGMIRLVFRQESEHCMVCEVTDNGVGMEKAGSMKSEQQRKRQSRGIGIIRERLGIINSTRGTNYSITTGEASPGNENPGTRVRIEIPCR